MFLPKRYPITMLAVVVLMTTWSGTAFAQARIGFSPTIGSVNEGASAEAGSEHPLLKVTVRAWGLPAGPAGNDANGQPTARQQAIDALGDITIETEGIGGSQAATISPVYDTPAALDEDNVFATNDAFQLTVTPVQDEDSRNDEFILRLQSTEPIRTGLAFRGTVIDDDPLATASFSRTAVKVVEDSTAPLSIGVVAPEGEDFPTFPGTRNIVLRFSPAAAVDVEECPTEGEPEFALRVWSATERLVFRSGTGELTISKNIADYEHGPAQLRLTACADMTDIGDSTVTATFKESPLNTPDGRIEAGPPAIIQILNGDPVPVVSMGTRALSMDEGMSKTVAILTDGELANLVMRIGLAVAGEARLSLVRSGRELRANADGTYALDLDANGSAVLTIRADADESLADGETKTATVTIVDANGADIGDRDTLTVTVRGSTAVPVLPQLGQLLLALLLLAGGARLYRRRSG